MIFLQSLLLRMIPHICLYALLLLLPQAFIKADKCGTFSDNRIQKAFDQLRKSEKILAPDLPLSIPSPSGNFLIHFAINGVHAVDSTDKNTNSIPDYIDSVAFYFDRAFELEITGMGFPKPPSDNGFGGNNAYDVYVVELAQRNIYGLTTVSGNISPSNQNHRYSTTYIEVDNNFSRNDRAGSGNPSFNTFGMDALKITAAHEFHHAIQLGNYGINDQEYDLMLYEMFSTWLEYHLYPSVKDYFFYVKDLFNNPSEYRFGQRNSQDYKYGYANAIFFELLHKRQGLPTAFTMWNLIGQQYLPFRALEMSLAQSSTPLDQLWCEYLSWCNRTGTIAKKYNENERFIDAVSFPTMDATIDSADPEALFSKSLYPYEIKNYKCLLRKESEHADSALFSISLTYPNVFESFGITSWPVSLIISNAASGISIPNTDFYYSIQTASVPFCMDNSLFEYKSTVASTTAYPNPFKKSEHKVLYLPPPTMAKLGDNVIVSVFSTVGKPIFSQVNTVEIDANNTVNPLLSTLIVPFEEAKNLQSGIYIFSIEYGENKTIGKFLIR